MNKKPLVSIIITYFYKKKFIKNTLNSILKQNYKNFELIFVFDNGSLNELNLIKKYLKNFKKKKIIINSKNYGVAKSRNIGLKFCKGEYIAFIDSDDIWNYKKLHIQIDFMIKKKTDLTFTSYFIIDENGFKLRKRIVNFDPTYSDLTKKNIIGLSTVIFHKRILNLVKFPNLKTQEDFALWLNLIKKGCKFTHIKKTLSSWRKTKNSLSSNSLQKITDAFKLYYNLQSKNLIISIYSVLVLGYNKLFK